PRAARLEVVDRELAALDTRGRSVAEAAAREGARLAELPAEVTAARDRLERARAAATEAVEVAARLAAHAQVVSLTEQLAAARTAHDEARELTLTLRGRALDVRQARLESMAAEIAGSLAVGQCCPVCGSAEHPERARAADGAPDAAAERAAQKAADAAAATEHLRDVEARDLATRLAHASERAGTELDPAALATRLEGLRAAADGADAAARALAAREQECTETGEALRRHAAEAAAVAASARLLGAEAADLRAELADVLADAATDSPDGLLADLLADLVDRERRCRALLRALDERDAAATAYDEARRELAEAAAEAGFDDPAEAVAAALDPVALERLAARVEDHERRLAAALAVLDEPGADELGLFPAPDLRALTADHDRTLAALAEARSAQETWTGRVERLTRLGADLGDALDRWAPVRADHELTTRLAAFVEGKSPDNRLQMRLSAYVLAYRLSQVVAAANERLARMSDQRYSLEHTGRRGAGETRGGLSLLVRDDWSGESRDPATLSGGETFVVSLALALGLADVITQETGGADLDTLFVDEGFGSLDADTLDDVLDTLDSLRDGGRVVGVVSHVAEMRDRIPTRLVVTKSRAGSTVAVTG
ncbi:SbcC/MukB-like Walker B domain-containing protein, partial [Nocardioides dongkuii]